MEISCSNNEITLKAVNPQESELLIRLWNYGMKPLMIDCTGCSEFAFTAKEPEDYE